MPGLFHRGTWCCLQLACQFVHELDRRGVLLQRVLGVFGDEGQQALDVFIAALWRGNQHNAAQLGIQQAQVVVLHRNATQGRGRLALGDIQEQLPGIVLDMPLRQGDTGGVFQRCLIAGNHFAAQFIGLHLIVEPQDFQ